MFAGYGGSKKSLCALNMSCHNSLRDNGGKSIYSTMEMSATNLLDRMIDFQFGKVTDGIISNRATDHWRNKLDESNKALIQKALTDSLKDYYSDSILISQEPRMSTDGYRRMIDKALEKNHEIDSLIVDGLSMMAGFGNEVEIYSENSRVLKELANEYNIAIPLICHLSKGADIDTRDVRPFIRGSQKILDNCDYVLMFSLIKDFNNVGEIEKDKGYIRMINKRGSGNVINHIYTFDEDRLLIEPSTVRPFKLLTRMKIDTKKDCLDFGKYLSGKNVKKEFEEFKKTSIFQESEFILFDFGVFLVGNPIIVQHKFMDWTTQIEEYNLIFKDV